MLAIGGDAGSAPDSAHQKLRRSEGLHHLESLRVDRLQKIVLSTGQHSA